MDFSALPDFVAPLAASVIAGGLIGLEREWRGRAAGLRTHILVCLASALLMEAAVSQGAWRFSLLPGQDIVADPVRMAHGVLTGIGFLCAGVIFRTGFSIHGLTTAASLWMTSALGLVFGAGLFELGAAATVTTGVVLAALRIISRSVPQRLKVDAEVTWRTDAAGAEAAIEAALAEVDPGRQAARFRLIDDGRAVSRSFLLRVKDEAAMKTLAGRLSTLSGVVGYRLDPRDE